MGKSWKETEHQSDLENNHERRRLGRNQHPFLTMFIWVALEENAKLARISRIITEACPNQGFLLVLWKKYQKTRAPGKSDADTISSWSCDMEGHAKKCVERFCELANKNDTTILNSPCIDDHQFKEEDMGFVGELSKVFPRIVLICLFLDSIGRPDIFMVGE